MKLKGVVIAGTSMVLACGGIWLCLSALLPVFMLQGLVVSPDPVIAQWDEETGSFRASVRFSNGSPKAIRPELDGSCGCEESSLPTEIPAFKSVQATLNLPLHKGSAGSNYVLPIVDKNSGKRFYIKVHLTTTGKTT